jgi:hypothetical protein
MGRRVMMDGVEREPMRNSGCKFCALLCGVREYLLPGIRQIEFELILCNGLPPRVDVFSPGTYVKSAYIFGTIPGIMTWGALPYIPPIPAPGSQESFAFVKRQLELCNSQHPACWVRNTATAPNRLLHVGIDNKSVHLVYSDVVSRERYAALSYCWGAGRGENRV